MSAFPYLVLLSCFVGLGVHLSEATPSPTPNPECPGMHRVATSLEKGIKTYTQEDTVCKVNSACTGLMCNGTHKQNDFYMKLELKHCKTPPTIHVVLRWVKKVNLNKEMKDGQRYKISSQKTPVGTIPIELKLTLKKHRNRITTGLEVQLCGPVGPCTTLFTLLPSTTFCLNMKTCPGYNSTGDIPCHMNPTGMPTGPISTSKHSSSTSKPRTHSPTHHSEPTKLVSTRGPVHTLRSSIKPSTQHSEPTKMVPTRGPVHTLTSSIKPSSANASGLTSTTALPGDAHAMKRGSGLHHISTGLAVGIAFACLVGVLIIVGATFYWKKFYRRSRLRAAYYNDISMNDPLYEDFEPEVA